MASARTDFTSLKAQRAYSDKVIVLLCSLHRNRSVSGCKILAQLGMKRLHSKNSWVKSVGQIKECPVWINSSQPLGNLIYPAKVVNMSLVKKNVIALCWAKRWICIMFFKTKGYMYDVSHKMQYPANTRYPHNPRHHFGFESTRNRKDIVCIII